MKFYLSKKYILRELISLIFKACISILIGSFFTMLIMFTFEDSAEDLNRVYTIEEQERMDVVYMVSFIAITLGSYICQLGITYDIHEVMEYGYYCVSTKDKRLILLNKHYEIDKKDPSIGKLFTILFTAGFSWIGIFRYDITKVYVKSKDNGSIMVKPANKTFTVIECTNCSRLYIYTERSLLKNQCQYCGTYFNGTNAFTDIDDRQYDDLKYIEHNKLSKRQKEGKR